ncbi:MAG: bifunctional folylpolyglutamate synthase/dihydrofolate synthase [Roseburia sp.]
MRTMTYEETVAYREQLRKSGSILGLDSIKGLMAKLSDVQEQLPVLHIAGTNGKGSVGAFLAAALEEAGYRVGRYTSPAVFDPLEVWQINETNITKETYARLLSQVKCACEAMVAEGMPQPTLFEVETAVAFLYFYQEKCDYVLLETGMGGVLDATNLITRPLCSIITSVSMDHMQFLGETLGEIAGAKAGIIKEGCPVATLWQKPEAMAVIEQQAKAKNAALYVADPSKHVKELVASLEGCSYRYSGLGELKLGTPGLYQVENSLLAAVVLKEVLHIPAEAIRRGFARMKWRGRFEILQKEPLFLIDGAHNEDAAEKLRATLQNYFTNRKITYIIGVLADKEHEKMLRIMLPLADRVFTVTPDNPRALTAEALAAEAARIAAEEGAVCGAEEKSVCAAAEQAVEQKSDMRIAACVTVDEAVLRALEATEPDGVILAFGSLSYLNEVRRALLGRSAGAKEHRDRKA